MTADMLGATRQTTNRFVLGDFEVTTILDGASVRDAIKPPFCMENSEAEIAEMAAAHHVPSDRFEHMMIPTLVNTGGALVLFDVGFGAMGAAMGAGHLRDRMAEAGYSPEDVDIVVITHMHGDHIAGLMADGARAFPNARYVTGQVEYDAWSSGEGLPETRDQNRGLFQKMVPPLADDMTFVQGGDTIVQGITAEEAFGHSPGHMMYRVESAGKSVLIWADLANHYVFSLAYPEAKVAYDDQPDIAVATRKRVLEQVARDGTMVIGHHMPFPGIGFVERVGERYRWVPASYQTRV